MDEKIESHPETVIAAVIREKLACFEKFYASAHLEVMCNPDYSIRDILLAGIRLPRNAWTYLIEKGIILPTWVCPGWAPMGRRGAGPVRLAARIVWSEEWFACSRCGEHPLMHIAWEGSRGPVPSAVREICGAILLAGTERLCILDPHTSGQHADGTGRHWGGLPAQNLSPEKWGPMCHDVHPSLLGVSCSEDKSHKGEHSNGDVYWRDSPKQSSEPDRIESFLGGSPSELAAQAIKGLGQHLGHEPTGDEARAVAERIRAMASELGPHALRADERGALEMLWGRDLCEAVGDDWPLAAHGWPNPEELQLDFAERAVALRRKWGYANAIRSDAELESLRAQVLVLNKSLDESEALGSTLEAVTEERDRATAELDQSSSDVSRLQDLLLSANLRITNLICALEERNAHASDPDRLQPATVEKTARDAISPEPQGILAHLEDFSALKARRKELEANAAARDFARCLKRST